MQHLTAPARRRVHSRPLQTWKRFVRSVGLLDRGSVYHGQYARRSKCRHRDQRTGRHTVKEVRLGCLLVIQKRKNVQ